MSRILVVDDEEAVLKSIQRRLERHGLTVMPAALAEDAIRLIHGSEQPFDVIVTDMSMEDPQAGMKVLGAAFERDLFAQVIIMTAFGNVANAVECMRRGAFDYIEKNSPGKDAYELLVEKIERALERRRDDVRTIEKWQRAAKGETV